MTPDDPNGYWWLRTLAYGLFASFGGMMGYMMRSIDKRQGISWRRVVLEGAAAAFVGLLVLLTCQAMELSEQWTGVIVGVSGWLGANATIVLLESVVLKKLGIDKQDPPTVRERKDDQFPFE